MNIFPAPTNDYDIFNSVDYDPQTESDGDYLNVDGDTMDGRLIIHDKIQFKDTTLQDTAFTSEYEEALINIDNNLVNEIEPVVNHFDVSNINIILDTNLIVESGSSIISKLESKELITVTQDGSCYRMIGTHGYLDSYDLSMNRKFYIGTPTAANINLDIINENTGGNIYLRCDTRLVTQTGRGISMFRGDIHVGLGLGLVCPLKAHPLRILIRWQ